MTDRIRIALALASTLLLATACGDDEAATPEPAEPAPEAADEAPEPPGEQEEEAEPAAAAPDPNEACAQAIVVAWQGAMAAGDDITRSEDEARARAEALKGRLEQGEDFAELARAESDAASSGPRGGLLGTYAREDFPEIHAPIRDAVFALGVNELSEPIRAPYGWVVARRCPVEKIHTRHILVRYQGARNAGDDITRSEDDAQARANELRAQVAAEGADFEAIAREASEDSSAERGGDLGMVGRGLLAPEYEEAAWALEVNQISEPVRTEFGYHIIQRLPDEDAAE